jgi:hypothetical protein
VGLAIKKLAKESRIRECHRMVESRDSSLARFVIGEIPSLCHHLDRLAA